MKSEFPFVARSYEFQPYVPCKNFVGGEWCDSYSGENIEILNPRHNKIMGTCPASASTDIDHAVQAAKKAFPGWSATPLKERAQVLYRLKTLMEENLEELTWLLSHENGKTYAEAKGSVLKGIECIELGTALPNMVAAGQIDVSRGVNCKTTHEPLGVVAGIIPFNFPTMVPLWMLPQALVSGNTFVLKPSEQVPYGSMRLAELFREAGLPNGVLNIVNGAQPAVEAIVDHPDIKAVGFVGSTKVAKIVYERGSKTGKRMLCLGGAKNHLVVVPDANPELTASNVVASATGCAGQRCMAASVMLAVGDVQPIIDSMVTHARKVTLGEDMGAINAPASVERIHGYIKQAKAEGATILVDGRNANVPTAAGGLWVGPTIIDNVRPEMAIAREEVFGPVLTIIRVNTLDEAIAIENANPYGNAAAIFTTNGATSRYALERFQAGMCGVNVGVPVPREPFSFGGWNNSKFGHGDMTGVDGYRFWTRPRKITTKWELQTDQTWMS